MGVVYIRKFTIHALYSYKIIELRVLRGIVIAYLPSLDCKLFQSYL